MMEGKVEVKCEGMPEDETGAVGGGVKRFGCMMQRMGLDP